ncbi:MAG: hypothetical protein HZB56_11570 [Deltaproteobacteria bacterium]|nr:hypothetical protein [Deltaproteobacteria bacterium]
MPQRLALSALFLLAAAACGGAEPAATRRPEAAPVLAVLSASSGPGVAELRQGQGGAARARFEAILAADPDRLGALSDLAVTYALDDRRDAARSLLDAVVAQGGPREQQLALVNLGELYALEGYLAAAQTHFDTARSIDPLRPEPVLAQALLASARGEREKALGLAREAVRLDEGGAARAALAFLAPEERLHLQALLAEARGDREAAAARWRELLAGRFPVLAHAARLHLDAP